MDALQAEEIHAQAGPARESALAGPEQAQAPDAAQLRRTASAPLPEAPHGAEAFTAGSFTNAIILGMNAAFQQGQVGPAKPTCLLCFLQFWRSLHHSPIFGPCQSSLTLKDPVAIVIRSSRAHAVYGIVTAGRRHASLKFWVPAQAVQSDAAQGAEQNARASQARSASRYPPARAAAAASNAEEDADVPVEVPAPDTLLLMLLTALRSSGFTHTHSPPDTQSACP